MVLLSTEVSRKLGILLCFLSWASILKNADLFCKSVELLSAAGDKKQSLLSLTLEKPEHPQGRDSSLCTIVLYSTIVKSLLILFGNCSYSSWEKKACLLQMDSSPICTTHFEMLVVKRKVLQDPLKL